MSSRRTSRRVSAITSLWRRSNIVARTFPLLLRRLMRHAFEHDPSLAQRLAVRGPDGQLHPRISAKLIALLLESPLPLQVRQIDTIMWQCLAESPGDTLKLAASLRARSTGEPSDAAVNPAAVSAEELKRCLEKHDGVQERVWRELGLQNRYVLRRLMKKHGL